VADLANETLRQHTRSHPETEGMGATLVVPCLVENRLYWISVGDSPLFLYRGGRLIQLNEDHSMAPQIDFMVKSGLMDAETGANHPDRNCLISVLMGTRIPKIDCPTKPYELRAGDIVICSSDGLQFLTNAQIERVLGKYAKKRSTEIAERLLEELQKLDDPDQDNISFTIIKVNDASVRPKENRVPRPSMAIARPKRLTTVVTEPLLLPLQPIPGEPEPTVTPKEKPQDAQAQPEPAPEANPLPLPEQATAEPEQPDRAEPAQATTGRKAPTVVVVQEVSPKDDSAVEDLTPVRLRPRRVIVIK
jgi:hypothetical protein